MSVRLTASDRLALAADIQADINAYCIDSHRESYRDHLGASEIGETCERRLVYSFRWMHREQFDGRMLRLFNRGHLEENRIVEWLAGIGCILKGVDGNQIRMKSDNPHYGGSLDGMLALPEKYKLNVNLLLEMKTHNHKSFTRLIKDGVKVAKPKHFVQMCAYAHSLQLDYGLYFAVNKNDDDIHVEIVEIDHSVGQSYLERANNVISAQQLPNKIAASDSFWVCKYCPMADVCHNGAAVDRNCRSCASSTAVSDGTWRCSVWNAVIPHDSIPFGCGQWSEFK